MKLSVVCLLALVALASAGFVAATEREVRSYTSEMEYVDHVDMPAHAEDLPVADHADHAMMETASAHSDEADHSMHFSMESESESVEDAASAFDLPSFLEAGAEEELDTEALRAVALEIHDSAQAMVGEDGEVLMEVSAEAETESESEAEAESESELDAEMEGAEDDKYLGLSPAEIAQAKADEAAEKKDVAAEKADKAEEKVEQKEAAKDAAVLATPNPEPVKQTAVPTATAPATPAPAAPVTATSAPTASKTVVQLPSDLSAEHAVTLRANEAATATIGTAMKEVGAILQSKDDTIRSLVYNISYLTVGIGKLANRVDSQRTYIAKLQEKLRLSESKVSQLESHVSHSKATAASIREQLKTVEARLNAQDSKTTEVASFLKANQDQIALPVLADDLEIRGSPIVPRRAVQKLRTAINARMRPVAGTQTYAERIPFIPSRGSFYPASYVPSVPAWSSPDGIPTIIIEREDDGQ